MDEDEVHEIGHVRDVPVPVKRLRAGQTDVRGLRAAGAVRQEFPDPAVVAAFGVTRRTRDTVPGVAMKNLVTRIERGYSTEPDGGRSIAEEVGDENDGRRF